MRLGYKQQQVLYMGKAKKVLYPADIKKLYSEIGRAVNTLTALEILGHCKKERDANGQFRWRFKDTPND